MGSYSRTGYMAIKKEATENTAVTPNVFIPFLSESVVTEWAGQFSQSIVGSRAVNFRPISHAIPAPSGDVVLEMEPITAGYFLLGAFGAVTTGRYIPITSASGTFTVGETITGGSSTATAVITAVSSEDDYILTGAFTGTFTDGETITGGTSSVTATLTKADSLVYGHQVVAPQTTIDTTFTVEFGFDNEVHRYTGVRFHEMVMKQNNNVITATMKVSARCAFNVGYVTEAESSGAGSHTVLLDQTTGLVASDTIKVYRPGTGFLDFSASGVKTHTIGTVASETSITFTNLQTALAIGDLIVLAPQTESYSIQKEFIWAGGAIARIASTITAALTASADNIEDFELSIVNNIEPRHAATGANTKNRFPSVVFTAGFDGSGMFKRTYTDVTYLDKMRRLRQFAFQILMTGEAISTALDFNYLLDIRVADARHMSFTPNIATDDLINQDMDFKMLNSTTDGYVIKALLVNTQSSY